MARLHLQPLPTAEINPFPSTLLAQLERMQGDLVQRHGSQQGRILFAEAAIAAIGRAAVRADQAHAMAFAIEIEYSRATGQGGNYNGCAGEGPDAA